MPTPLRRNLRRWFPRAHQAFLMIAEPRVTRLIHFGIYLSLLVAGVGVMYSPPSTFQEILGVALVHVFGGFIILGGILGAFAVLPGIWWLERAGLIALGTGLALYLIIVVGLQSSPIGVSITLAFLLTFVLRWMDIKGAQLAPREE